MNSPQNLEINIMSNIMDFKKRAKEYGFLGRPFINGKVSKTYLKYLKSNPLAPVPFGKVYYNKKIVDRSKLVDKRSKTGKLKPSVRKVLNQKLLPLRPKLTKKITVVDSPNFESSRYIYKDLDISFLTEDGRNQLSVEVTKLRKEASINYNPNTSDYVLTFLGTTFKKQNDILLKEPFRLTVSGKKLKSVNKDFEEYWNNWIQNNIISGSLFQVIIHRIELRVIGTNMNVGTTGGHSKIINIDNINK